MSAWLPITRASVMCVMVFAVTYAPRPALLRTRARAVDDRGTGAVAHRLRSPAGDIDDGWTVAKYLLEFERGGGAAAPTLQVMAEEIANEATTQTAIQFGSTD